MRNKIDGLFLDNLGLHFLALRLLVILVFFVLLKELEHPQRHLNLLFNLKLKALHIANHLVDLLENLFSFLFDLAFVLNRDRAIPSLQESCNRSSTV